MSIGNKVKLTALLSGEKEVSKELIVAMLVEKAQSDEFVQIIKDAVEEMPTCDIGDTVTIRFKVSFTA